MFSSRNCDTFCIFCYKTTNRTLKGGGSDLDIVKKFAKLLEKFAPQTKLNKLLITTCSQKELPEFLLKCCKNCARLSDEFCELFCQLKVLELKLNWKLNQFVEILEFANKVPTRWIHLNKVLEVAFPKDLGKRKQSQTIIREFRQGVVKAAHQKSQRDQPRVLVENCNVIQPAVQISKYNLINGDDLTFSDNEEQIDYSGDNEVASEEDNHAAANTDRNTNKKVVTDTFIKRQCFGPTYHDTNSDISDKCEDDNESIGWSPEQIKTKKARKFNRKRKVGRPRKCPEITQVTQQGNPLQGRKVGRPKNAQKIARKLIKISLRKKVSCEFCKNLFSGAVALEIHINMCRKTVNRNTSCSVKHTKEKRYNCKFCGIKYGYRISLKNHLKEKHGEENGVEEEIKKRLPRTLKTSLISYKPSTKTSRTQIEGEIKDKKLSFCKYCKKAFSNFKRLKAHIKTSMCTQIINSDMVNKTCTECSEDFNSDKELWMHLREAHGVRVCLECGKQFKKTYNLKVHLEYHKDKSEWKFECETCGMKCATKYKLNDHMVTHAKKKGPKALPTKQGGIKRRNNETESKLDKVFRKKKSVVVKSLTNRYVHNTKCGECREKFNLTKELWVHLRETHEQKVCLDCGKLFKETHDFMLHLEYHKDPKEWKFECEVCGKKCVSCSELKRHVANHSRKNYRPRNQVVKKKTGSTSVLTKTKPLSATATKLVQSRYELRKTRATNFLNVDEVGFGDNEKINIEDNLLDGKKKDEKEGTPAAVQNIIMQDGSLSERIHLNKTVDKSEKKERSSYDSKVLDENNLLAAKGDCFGDGNLVEFEDLD